MPRATRFDDFPGDKWRRQDPDLCESELSYPGFEKSDVDVVNPSLQEPGRAGWSARYESQAMAGEREPGAAAAEVSAVDLTAPSFVKDRQFMDRSEYRPPGEVASRLDVNLVSQQMDGLHGMSRPASLKRKTAKVCTSGDDSVRGNCLDRAGKIPLGLGARAECLSIPDSLRSLRKRNGKALAGEGVCAIKKAFDSMVFMIRALQSYTLQLRQTIVSDVNVQHLMSMVHREMHASFVWLFQQVFSCTPTLMVSVMILLANFTVFSLGNNVAMGAVMAPERPTELVYNLQTPIEKSTDRWNGLSFVRIDRSLDPSPEASTPIDSAGHGFGNYGSGGIRGGSIVVACGEDGDLNVRGAPSRNAMFSEKDFDSVDFSKHPSAGRGNLHLPRDAVRSMVSPELPGISNDKDTTRAWTDSAQPANAEELRSSEQLRSHRLFLLEQTVRDLELKPGEPYHHVQLDQETLRILVAPVSTKLELDNYLCFDRTDLEYQHAIRAEPFNPMLLANYAQFLYAVRHDNARAEEFFHRALRVDSQDGDTLGRWASFLWLALKDRPRADNAYRQAISLDTSNPFHAGSYAHFLWHADDD